MRIGRVEPATGSTDWQKCRGKDGRDLLITYSDKLLTLRTRVAGN